MYFSDTRRSNIHRKKHTFFRASEYISQDFKQYGVSKEKTESRIDIKEKFKDEEIYKDREAQIKAIEQTFTDALVSFKFCRLFRGLLYSLYYIEPVFFLLRNPEQVRLNGISL